MSENERIKEIRKSLNMTMEQFGERLGVTKTAISNIEKSNRNVTEQMRKSIFREFNINENWFRTGNGDMFNSADSMDITSDHFEHLRVNASPQKKAVLSALVEMMYYYPDDKWDYVFNQFENCLQEARKGKVSSDLFEGVPVTATELETECPPLKTPRDNEEAG